MPIAKVCAAPGCDELALPGAPHCQDHADEAAAKLRASRERAKLGEAAKAGSKLYRSAAWQKAARAFLALNPLCADCEELGLVELATDVDHIKPHRGDLRIFWDRSNWRGLCHSCHSRKTAREVFAGRKGR